MTTDLYKIRTTRANHRARLHGYRKSREYQDWSVSIGNERDPQDYPSLVDQRWEIDSHILAGLLRKPTWWLSDGSVFLMNEVFEDFHVRITLEGDRAFCEFARWSAATANAAASEDVLTAKGGAQ